MKKQIFKERWRSDLHLGF